VFVNERPKLQSEYGSLIFFAAKPLRRIYTASALLRSGNGLCKCVLATNCRDLSSGSRRMKLQGGLLTHLHTYACIAFVVEWSAHIGAPGPAGPKASLMPKKRATQVCGGIRRARTWPSREWPFVRPAARQVDEIFVAAADAGAANSAYDWCVGIQSGRENNRTHT
jgi:hypothetical protein